MTARITDAPFESETVDYHMQLSDGDLSALYALEASAAEVATQQNTPGQLWERVERATINDDALTEEQWGRMAAMRNTLGTRRTGGPTYDHSERGPRLMSQQSYGIIRAGNLEWRSIHAEQGCRPYVHTGFEAGAL